MFTLHKTIEITKQVVKWLSISIVGIVALVFLFRMTVGVFDYFFPKGPKPPNYALGVIPKLQFPSSTIDPQLTFIVDTISGTFPEFDTTAEVYKINREEPSLLNLERARAKIQSMGVSERDIKSTEKTLSSTEYQWQDRQGLIREITMDTTTFDFRIRSIFQTDATILRSKGSITKEVAIEKAKNLLNSLQVDTEAIDLEKIKAELITIENGILLPASSLSTSQVVRVSFYHKSKNDLPIFYPVPQTSIMNFIISNGATEDSIVYGDFYDKSIGEDSGTYPIKTATEAFDELSQGKGYIATYDGQKKHVTIRNVTLGYFMSTEHQEYLMPIIVFEGDGNFVAYISAVSSLAAPEETN